VNAPAPHLEGFDAGRLQGWLEGRQAGYRLGYDEGRTAGIREGWLAAGEDERQRFAIVPTVGTSHAELQRIRAEHGPVKPLKTPAECLATWGDR
jgi:hypothetical protein